MTTWNLIGFLFVIIVNSFLFWLVAKNEEEMQ